VAFGSSSDVWTGGSSVRMFGFFFGFSSDVWTSLVFLRTFGLFWFFFRILGGFFQLGFHWILQRFLVLLQVVGLKTGFSKSGSQLILDF
jgi:hypothetical protein